MSLLDPLLPGFTPTPLQQAAIDRIQYFQQALRRYGMNVRSSIELEFTIDDSNGRPQRIAMNFDKAKHYFDAKPELSPYIEKIVAENDLMPGLSENNTCKFEVTTADPMRKHDGAPLSANPARLAAVIVQLKNGGLAEMLRHTTSLSGISPNFSARPYEGIGTSVEDPVGNITSSMHINVSLCDRDGNNLFAKSVPLLYHCTNSIMELQRHAALATLPNENSLSRVKSNSTVPNVIGIQRLKFYDGRKQNNGWTPSVCVRDDMLDSVANIVHREPKYHRIENKLPGSDADPFVSMATTLAGVYDAVTRHVVLTPTEKGGVHVKIAPSELTEKLYEMPDTYVDMVKKIRAANHVKDLLGEQLYASILSQYGQSAPSR